MLLIAWNKGCCGTMLLSQIWSSFSICFPVGFYGYKMLGTGFGKVKPVEYVQRDFARIELNGHI